MINGAIARTTNIGILLIVGLCVVGLIVLAIYSRDIPSEMSMVLTAGIGFLVGTKFTPLDNYTEKEPGKISPTDKVVVNEKSE